MDAGNTSAEQRLGTAAVARRAVGSAESQRASRAWWDADADDYHRRLSPAARADMPDNEFYIACMPGIYHFTHHTLERGFDRDDYTRPVIFAEFEWTGLVPETTK